MVYLQQQHSSEATTEAVFLEESHRLDLRLNLPLEDATIDSIQESALPMTVTRRNRKMLTRMMSQKNRERAFRAIPWVLSAGILTVNLLIHSPLFVVGACAASLTFRIFGEVVKRSRPLQRILASISKAIGLTRIDKKWLNWVTFALAGGLFLTLVSPAHALFFQAAEQYMNTIFTGGGTNAATTGAIALVFGALRIIFVLYLAISLIRVIQAFRQDEDWVTAARIPMMVVLCVVLGDVLSTLIVQ